MKDKTKLNLWFARRKAHILRHKLYYIYILVVGMLICLLTYVSRSSVAFSEWYASQVYFFIQNVISRITGIFPFSLYELLICIFIFSILYLLFQTIRRCIKKHFHSLRLMYARTFAITLTVFLVYILNCGINYHRLPFSSFSGLTLKENSSEALIELCELLIQEANQLVPYIDTIDNAAYGALFTLSNTDEQKEAVAAMTKLGNTYPILSGFYPQPKPVLTSFIMSYEFITGVYSPFTIEANYNNDVPDYVKAYTMCHELSHLTGFMREDEAEFIAFLACTGSSHVNFQYCGYVNALSYVMNSVYKNCGAQVYTELYKTMSPQIIRDYTYDNDYWDKYRTPVAEISDTVNNVYLQANAQTDGVKSYGRMIDLLLAYYSSSQNN